MKLVSVTQAKAGFANSSFLFLKGSCALHPDLQMVCQSVSAVGVAFLTHDLGAGKNCSHRSFQDFQSHREDDGSNNLLWKLPGTRHDCENGSKRIVFAIVKGFSGRSISGQEAHFQGITV